MNRRSFLKWLGIGVPAAAVAAVVVPALGTSVPEKDTVIEARLGEWNSYYSEGDPELMEAIENWKSYPVNHTATLRYDSDVVSTLKREDSLFEALASRKRIPVNTGVDRKFFQYETVS